MLVTSQPLFQRFWYRVMPMSLLADDKPQGFQLLGQKIVVWLGAEGKPAAAIDRCCHRSANLSLGSVTNGEIACAYHGWQYDSDGNCRNRVKKRFAVQIF